MWHTFYTTGMPVASCISGHCPAGGLIIASGSDYRVMQRGKFTTGLNEGRLARVSSTLCGVRSAVMFCFVFCLKLGSPIGLHSSYNISPMLYKISLTDRDKSRKTHIQLL